MICNAPCGDCGQTPCECNDAKIATGGEKTMKQTKRKQKPPIPTEYEEQCTIFRLAQLYQKKYPELGFLIGSLNGVRLTIGQAMKAKKTGLKKGVPDIFLPVARGCHAGLWVELKRIKGSKILPEQYDWQAFLSEHGYKHVFAYGAEEAWKVIIDYLSGVKNNEKTLE